ncbi:Retinoblastoma-binding protein 5 [Ceratobasidium theobromae]|uniref:Retinoblastoma-binding protein 5 n=1 Tax=Ceratobasidium theobromae TaxID=1582974 RepID=A0A5N5QSJ9_9AGAM|nr:Retinoblastoma-binding protein 5 [Ceratobasidium theobromae]
MNAALLDPFGQDYPESVENTLDEYAVCARFNGTGRFIAAGRPDGKTSIWDLETKGVIQVLTGHVKTITSVSWSRNSRYLLTSSKDWNCIIWDMSNGERSATIRFDAPVLQASFHPRNSKLMLVTLQSQQTFLVDLRKGTRSRTELVDTQAQQLSPNQDRMKTITAVFSPDGKTIQVGTSTGVLATFNTRSKALLSCTKVSNGNTMIKHISCDHSGKYLIVNSNDRIIRVLEITAQSYDLELLHMFSDPISKTPWNGICFSGDGEYVVAGAGNKSGHAIYIWDRSSGALVKILEGPTEPLVDADWHPFRPMLCSVASSGLIHIWKTTYSENWSAFAPGFEELEENVEYQEREDEFDVEDEFDALRRKRMEEEFDVDVETIEPINVGKHGSDAHLASQDDDDRWIALEPDDDTVLDCTPVLDVLERESEDEDEA